MQSEAISLAYRMWRREWRGKGKEYVCAFLIFVWTDLFINCLSVRWCSRVAAQRLLARNIVVTC